MSGFPVSLDRLKKKNSGTLVLNIILIFIILILLAEILFVSRYSRVYVVGDSMLPTLTGAVSEQQPGGDFLFADKYAKAQCGDIIVITAEDENGNSRTIIKRLIATQGQSVELRQGQLYIDGELVEESYVLAANNSPELPINTFGPVTVPEGCIFVLGDNRDVSSDSRGKYGMIDESEVIGVIAQWSLDLKDLITGWHTFFEYTLPSLF